MACRALLKRRKPLKDHLAAASRPLFIHRSHADDDLDYRSVAESFPINSSHSEDCIRARARKPELYKLVNVDYFRHRYTREPSLPNRAIYSHVLRQHLWDVSLRHASNTATKRQELGGDEDDTEAVAKRKKEASPEECDQAVEGLSNAKAKAQAKKALDSQSSITSALKKAWSVILGIGPALKIIASMSREDWGKKLVHWKQEFVSTMKHYWLGSKLLWADVRICSRLLMKLAGGKSLSRRERQQLTRTTADIFRLVPMAVFIIVPFMEFLLPVFLKLFPNMLPSTFQDKMKEEESLKRKLQARIEYAKFLQETAKEMAKEIQTSRSGEAKRTAEALDEFLNRVRKGTVVSNEEILGFAKLFNDELTLDNISRPRLVNMCKYMGIQPFGTDRYLRFMLRQKLQRIKKDDMMIQAEGLESFSEAELREDCRERGMLEPRSVEEMRQHLGDWLDLSLNHSVPSSLLILSRAFTVSGKVKPEEAVRATLSSLPDELVDTVSVELPSGDSLSERQRKLEYLAMEEKLIKEEEEKNKKEDSALEEMIASTSSGQETNHPDKDEQLCELSRALAVLASASSVIMEREEFLTLVNKEIELYNSKLGDSEKGAIESYKDESFASDEVDGVSSALIHKVDLMLHKLEKEIDDVDAKIGDQWKVLDRDHDGKVTAEEVFAAVKYLKKQIGKDGVQELISNLSKDRDGRIHVEDIVRLGSRNEQSSKADV